jgi:hypothetical protein
MLIQGIIHELYKLMVVRLPDFLTICLGPARCLVGRPQIVAVNLGIEAKKVLVRSATHHHL